MSSMPRDYQSIAGGLLQTVSRLGAAVGLGITTAIFDGIERSPPRSGLHVGDEIAPYSGTFWFSFAAAALSVFVVPFLRIGTQGHGEGKV